MKHIHKRWLSVFLTVAMILSMLPGSIFAAGERGVASIADALAGTKGAEFTVKGAVSFIENAAYVDKNTGQEKHWANVYIQDDTGSICLRFPTSNVNDVKLGDTVIGTGKKSEYNQVPQLDNATYQKSSGMTLTAKPSTIADVLNTEKKCTYVQLNNVKVEALDRYKNPILTDNNGNSVKLNRAEMPADIAVGDTLNVCAVVSTFYDKNEKQVKVELRNTDTSEVVKQVDPVDPSGPVITPIKDAVAGALDTKFTIKGVVTMSDGWNVYLQDGTGAIAVNLTKKDGTLKPGDTLIATGPRKNDKSGLPYLGERDNGATIEKSSGMALKAKRTTIGALTDADLCTYVHMTGLEVTEVYDNNGAYKAPNIKLKDAAGNTIQLYKAVVDKKADGTWAVQVGDKVNVTAAVGKYNDFQLRNTLPSEITASVDPMDTAGILGKNVVIYNPSVNKAISVSDDGYNRAGVDITVADGALKGYGRSEIWTVGSDGEGHYIFNSLDGGKKLSMDGGHKSLGVNEPNDTWTVEAGNTGWVITNVNRKGYTIQWKTFEGAANFSSFNHAEDNAKNLKFFVVETLPDPEEVPGAPANGAQVVIYNKNKDGEAVMGLADEQNASLSAVPVTVESGKATVGNGGRVFTVTVNQNDYIFESGGKYLAANDKENLFLADKPDDYAKWNLEPAKKGVGFMMKNKAASYTFQDSTDSKPVYIEYFGGKFTGWTLSGKNGYEIYTMQFLPVANKTENIMEGVVNLPVVVLGDLPAAYVSQDYVLAFNVDAPFGLKSAAVTLNGKVYTPKFVDGQYVITVPAEEVKGAELSFAIDCVDNKDVNFKAPAVVPVVDVPLIVDPVPAPNAAVEIDKRPEISVTVTNGGENFKAEMTVNDQKVVPVVTANKVSYKPKADLADGPVSVSVKIIRADKSENTYTWKFSIGQPMEQLYFGQLHSHTTYSDGAGSLESALKYVSEIPSRDKVDFVSFTDHSNYFDGSKMGGSVLKEGALFDMSEANGATTKIQDNWNKYKQTVADFNASQSKQIALAGFEMTWSGGPGHINTFNTPGIVSRNNKTLNDKTADAGMKAYYALLNKDAEAAANGAKNWDGTAYDGKSISQFNHPGKTFGTFKDFAYWDPVTDQHMFMVEVGNGEGKIHAGGYYPSYSEYTKALDKGWHLAPTNNQDNHKGRWGNANDARDVILTDDFSEQGIYQAIRDMRMYATEDKNLEMFYRVNGQPMGSIISEVPEKLNFEIELNDPDLSDVISKVELIVNSGRVAYTWDKATAASGKLTCSLAPEYSYYYVRVTEADGDMAVSAPVWVGEVLKLGISSVESDTAMPVTGEELNVKTTVFNSEPKEAKINKITYTVGEGENRKVLATDTEVKTVNPSSTLTVKQPFTFKDAQLYTVKVTVDMEQGGKKYTYSMDIQLDVEDASKLVYVGFDAAHYNEYVSGNYKDSMGNFANLASGYAVRTVYLDTSKALIAACTNPKYKMLILTAPSRRLPDAQANPRSWSAEEIEALKAFNAAGGTIVMAGWSDHYEDFPDALPKEFKHMSEAQNEVLKALGSSLRINDDATYDDKYSKLDSCDPWRLYFNTYNMDNPLNSGVIYDKEHNYDRLYTEVFSHYGGASIYAVDTNEQALATLPSTVSPVVFGHESTYSKDTDGDGKGVVKGQMYISPEKDNRLLIMASEQLPGKGQIIVSGAAFMSNFEVQATMDNGQQKNYSNYRICENLVKGLNQQTITKIADVQAEKNEGIKFTIEGMVTSNASGFDANTAFFDCIYVQDETAGINAFPVAGNFKIGDKVRITGHTSSYNGERQLAVKRIEKIGTDKVPTPKTVTAAQINNGSVLGSLVTLKGTVSSFSKDNGLIQTIMVRDGSGQEARVFIDGYITKDQDVQGLSNGCAITVTGLASYDNSFAGPAPRIRIRDRADVICTSGSGGGSGSGSRPSVTEKDFVDVPAKHWASNSIYFVAEHGIINGTGRNTFSPDMELTRGMMVTILHNMEKRPTATVRSGFKDVDPAAWYAPAVDWAAEKRVVAGVGNDRFAPDLAVSREQLAVMLYNHMGCPAVAEMDRTFSDMDSISPWAIPAMKWAVNNGIIAGTDDGRLAPQLTATRAQAAVILAHMVKMQSGK